MQIPSVREFFNSETPYFLGSSWKERTIQVLCFVSFLALIYYVAFRKKTDETPGESNLDSRVSKEDLSLSSSQGPESSDHRVSTAPPSLCPEETRSKKSGYKIRSIIFGHWLSVKRQASDTWMTMAQGSSLQKNSSRAVLQKEIPELKEQLAIMIPIFQACPEILIADWDAFLKGYEAIAGEQANLALGCKKIRTILKRLQFWNNCLQSHFAKKTADEPDFWDLYHSHRLVTALNMTCDRLVPNKTRSLLKTTFYSHVLRTFMPELRDQVEKMITDFQPFLKYQTYSDGFFEKQKAVEYRKAGLQTSCKNLKERLISLESHGTELLSRYELTKNIDDTQIIKAFQKDFKLWLSEKIESCDYLLLWAQGSSFQPDICKAALKTFIPELKKQVEKMIRFFQAYTEIKTEALATFIENCDKVAASSKDPVECCQSIKKSLEKLQSWENI